MDDTFRIIRKYEDPKIANYIVHEGYTFAEVLHHLCNLDFNSTASLRRTANFGKWWDEMEEE